jgi:hypothetical protein
MFEKKKLAAVTASKKYTEQVNWKPKHWDRIRWKMKKARFYKNKKGKQGQTAYKKSFTESEAVTAETFIASTVKYVC